MKDAVKRFINVANDNAEPLMTWEDVRETRGRPTSLHAADEADCADIVQYFLDKRLYFHLSLIQSIARRMFRRRRTASANHFWQRYAFPEQPQVTFSCASGCEGSNRCAALKARQGE